MDCCPSLVLYDYSQFSLQKGKGNHNFKVFFLSPYVHRKLEDSNGGELQGVPFYLWLSSCAIAEVLLSVFIVPSKRWEAMAAWCDMLFLTMSPFRHKVTSCCLK